MLNRFVAVVIVLVLVLSAAPLAFGQGDEVTVRLWMHVHPPRIELDEELIAQFEAENPGIKVEYTTIADQEWDTALATALASGSGPDLFNQATFAIGDFYSQGVLAPIMPEAAGYGDQQAVYDAYSFGDALLAGAVFDETLYGLPTELSTYACFTNDDLWAAAGLDPATDFPATWEEMKDVAEQLTIRDDSGAMVQRGFDFFWSNSIFMALIFNPMVEQLGGNMIDEVNLTASIDTPEVRQVMSYWYDWANTWELGGPQYTLTRTAFLAGELAIDCDFGNWGVPQMVDAGINYSIHPQPRWADSMNNNAMSIYAYFFMVNSGTSPEVQEAAWKLASYLTAEPQQYLDVAGLFQSKLDFVESETFQENEIMPIFLEEMGVSKYHPRIPAFFEVADALMRGRDRIVVGGESMDTVLSEVEQEVNDIFARASDQ
ncbi:extracellular solute-binding protein [Chloroflexota bacterium]